MANAVTLSDVLQPLVEHELAELHAKAADLGPDDIESRAHDLVYDIVAKVREHLGFDDGAIRWAEGERIVYGFIGKVRAFSISWALTRDHSGKPWLLTSELPQLPSSNYATIEDAKEGARVRLRMFLGHFAENGARPAL